MTAKELETSSSADRIKDPARLAALQRIETLDESIGPAFDRLARLASAALDAPVALISLIDVEHERVRSTVGLPQLWSSRHDIPLDSSFCKTVISSGAAIQVEDIDDHSELRDSATLRSLGLTSYAAVPLINSAGYALGVVAVGDKRRRKWSEGQLALLADLAALLMTEIDLRCEVAERLRIEQEHSALIARLQELLQTRERFLSIAAHELRTPLTAMLGSAQLLQRHLSAELLPERDRRLLETIASEVLILDRMIEGLVDVSRAQTRRLRVVTEPLELSALVDKVVSSLQPVSERERIELVVPDRPLVVLGDAQRLAQVLNHLLQNALLYSPAGGPIRVLVEERDSTASVTIVDQGVGIPRSELPKLFSPFYRAPNVRALRAGGLGIGLYLVKQLMTLHGGSVELTSEEYEGSTFRICLPLYGGVEQDNMDRNS